MGLRFCFLAPTAISTSKLPTLRYDHHGVDVIIDCDYSVEAELPAIQRAVEAGIPVIGYGLVFPPDSPVITTSACAYYEQGFLVGMYIADYYKDDPTLKWLPPV